jgi:hypothetical protein
MQVEILRAFTVFLDGFEIIATGAESNVANGTELLPCSLSFK